MRHLRGTDLRLALVLLVGLDLLVRLDLLPGLEMLPGTLLGPRGRTANCAGRLMIVQPGPRMGEVCRTRCRQDLRSTAVLGGMQRRHTLRLLPVILLLAGQPNVMLTHGNTIVGGGLRAQATLTAIEAHVRIAPMRRRRV